MLVALTMLSASVEVEAASSFGECQERFERLPGDYDSAFCFYEVARSSRQWSSAADQLKTLIEQWPENHWPRLVLAHIYWRIEPDSAASAYRRAASGFRAGGDAGGEVLSRVNLYDFLAQRGELGAAEAEVERVAEIASEASDPVVVARAFTLEAQYLRDRGSNLEAAFRLLLQAERLIFPGGPYRLRRHNLLLLGSVSHRLGRYSQAAKFYRRLEEMARAEGDEFAVALFIYNQANTMLAGEFELPTKGGRERLIGRFREALDAAVEGGNISTEAYSHRSLGDLLGPFEETREEADRHFEKCIDQTRAMGRPRMLALGLAAYGGHLARWGRLDEAEEIFAEGLAEAESARDISVALPVHEQRMFSRWNAGRREEALEEARRALDALESLRDEQQASSGLADLLAAWSDLYYWPAGRLLESEDGPSREDLKFAFSFIERLRSRVLLESTTSSRAATFELDEDAWAPVLADLVRVQRQLLEPGLGEIERRRALRELERAEMNEAEVWRHVQRGGGSMPAAEGSPGESSPAEGSLSFADLDEVEQALAPNEALLSFQVALWQDVYGNFGGGSWLLVSTRAGTRPYRLPDRAALRPAIRLFTGLIEGREEAASAASVRLYQSLLHEALADLPPAIDRLLIVPDGDLHRLPFSALRARADAPVLAQRFHLSRIPSATLWLRWRAADEVAAKGPILAFADPLPASRESVETAVQVASNRDWALSSGAVLGALPHARHEGDKILDRLGSGHLLVGAAATESFLKSEALGEFGVLHFAAHAVIDAEHPQRSAVLLAPGAEHEDGLLQPRDIARLELGGKVVVLSACQGSSGAVLRGEGVLSLARAFFAAGSSSVIGSLWRLRDDEAAWLFDRFYAYLAQGESVEAALARAQGDLIRAGAPPAAWAGLSVLGDGGVVPFPEADGRSAGDRFLGGRISWFAISGLSLAALGLWLWRRFRL